MTSQASLFDLPAPASQAVDTSEAAAFSMRGPAPILRLRVCAAIAEAGRDGLTADEAADALALSVLAVRPRVTELSKAGTIADSGKRRRNASGRAAAVWIRKDLAEEL